MLIDIRTTISKVYAEHPYLQEHLQDEEIIKFDRIVREDPSYPTLRHALGELSEYPARYHQQKCIVLIDEYDAPIGAAYHKGYYDDAMDFFHPMFSSLLKDNINLHKAFSRRRSPCRQIRLSFRPQQYQRLSDDTPTIRQQFWVY
ncbi:hypothetical protein BC938DRAFT_473105 [Jimgerdemannia flammicorona]|uniref:AAA-ATPase-like domain-containing protein n=1 Tax=Jimgerdemannia flammicorona TaxID=994334 RepID=A0A433Q4P0_9FUNG|nr:hypothetical protein BC938DRAFT_473105 [Jimgerdemannia flammicorona]